MSKHNFGKISLDHYVFVKNFVEGDFLILLIDMNDMLMVDCDKFKIDKSKSEMSQLFTMKDLGLVKEFSSKRITQKKKSRK